MSKPIRQVKAGLNGGRGRTEHPGVPLTPAELAAALDAAGIGAEAGVWTAADARQLVRAALAIWSGQDRGRPGRAG